jgi:hypothetical protein
MDIGIRIVYAKLVVRVYQPSTHSQRETFSVTMNIKRTFFQEFFDVRNGCV